MDEDEEDDIPITQFDVAKVSMAFSGHAGYRFCEILVETDSKQRLALKFSHSTARAFLEKFAQALDKLEHRSEY
jgi:hypothetical protein